MQGRVFWRRGEMYKRMKGFLEKLPEENKEGKFQLVVSVWTMKQMIFILLSNEQQQQQESN